MDPYRAFIEPFAAFLIEPLVGCLCMEPYSAFIEPRVDAIAPYSVDFES